nr:uncharacterized protein LOC105476891 isoform X2 [Macaca nemestrina]XP_011731500.1 uncharacterized protein LOC105476891 isoform X2 [Macaca nemestrina]
MSLCETFACELGGTGKSCTCSYLTAVKLNVKGSVGKEKEGVAPEGTYCLLGKKTNSEDLTAGGPIKIPTATKGHKETGGKIPRTYSRLYHDSEASQRLNQCPDFHKICAPLSVPGVLIKSFHSFLTFHGLLVHFTECSGSDSSGTICPWTWSCCHRSYYKNSEL